MNEMSKKACIFDLDGTLFDTLSDLVIATYYVIEKQGMPQLSRERIASIVGGGGAQLLTKAVPCGTSVQTIDAMYKDWEVYLAAHGVEHTSWYDGVEETLEQLKCRGVKLAVLSNKPDSATQQAVNTLKPQFFDRVHGSSAAFPRKPDPTGLFKTMEELGVSADECLFIGDSANDIHVAQNAGVFCLGVLWGYGEAEGLFSTNPDTLIERPAQILDYL